MSQLAAMRAVCLRGEFDSDDAGGSGGDEAGGGRGYGATAGEVGDGVGGLRGGVEFGGEGLGLLGEVGDSNGTGGGQIGLGFGCRSRALWGR